MTGRPSDFTQDISDRICQELAEGNSLRSILKADGMPAQSTVFRWLANNEDFRKQYAHARELQTEKLAEEILEIADDGTNDFGFKEDSDADGDGAKPVFLAEHVQRSKLRVDTRKWLMAKMAPKKFGEFQRTELTGKDGGPVVLSIADQIRKAHGD